MTDYSEGIIRAREALALAEQEPRHGRYGNGCKALDSVVIAIRCTQSSFKVGRETQWEQERCST